LQYPVNQALESKEIEKRNNKLGDEERLKGSRLAARSRCHKITTAAPIAEVHVEVQIRKCPIRTPLSLADNKASQCQQKQKSQVEAFIHFFFLIPQETLKSSVFHAIKLNNYND
jgi:hypothetical protein